VFQTLPFITQKFKEMWPQKYKLEAVSILIRHGDRTPKVDKREMMMDWDDEAMQNRQSETESIYRLETQQEETEYEKFKRFFNSYYLDKTLTNKQDIPHHYHVDIRHEVGFINEALTPRGVVQLRRIGQKFR